MLFSAVKFTCAYLWLFVLRFGWAQIVLNNSQTKDGLPELIRLRRATTNAKSSPCLTPPQPVNGEYKLERYFCDDIADCKVAEGTALDPGSQLVYRCNPGYEAKGYTDVYCRSRGKWSAIPECVEVKCETLNSVSTTVSCTRFGSWINCDSAVPPETRAEVACRHGYKKDTDFVTTRRANVNCQVNGQWDPQPIRCVPVCGVAITHQQPFVLGGSKAAIGDFPWHASLFIQTNTPTGKKKTFICGATIIQSNLLLTAAHCVYDETTRTTQDSKKLFVATGNIFRDYDSPLHNTDIVRKATVKHVYTFCNYYGLTGNYVSDIALLVLHKPFEFSSILLPACLDDSGFSEQFLEPGAYGRVAGFGRTDNGASSSILQTITVPYISYSQCKTSNNAAQNEAFISSDKFCAGYNNGSAVCEGDSGGGLVFRKGELWYVMGIVSVGLGVDIDNGEKTCDKFSYSLYTKVPNYMTWIQDVLSYVERNQQYPSCNRNSQNSMKTDVPKVQPITTPNIPTTVTTAAVTGSSCPAPPQPANGEWKLDQNFCPRNTDCKISEGTPLESGSQLVYRCAPEFKAKGSTTVHCGTDGKWTSIPTCNGDSCSLTNGSIGSCTLLKNCQSVLEELKLGKSPDTQCGFSRSEPIVCCPETKDVAATTATPSLPGDMVDLVGDGRGEIAKQKCMEYAQPVIGLKCPSFVVGKEEPVNVSESTGKSKAHLMEFTYMAAVGFQSDNDTILWYCGGTLISEIFVLTAAACTYSPSFGNAEWVRVGDLNLVQSDDGAKPEDRRIIERIRNPSFKPPLAYHDIALLRLESAVHFNDWIRPACLYTAPSIGTKEAIATGWGRVHLDSAQGSTDLMKVTLPLVDPQTCKKNWSSESGSRRLPNGIVEDWLICAGAEGKDTCQGDSGGPLAIRSKKEHCMYDVAGITSLGRACGLGVPALYTRVYHYIPWIESVVWGRG